MQKKIPSWLSIYLGILSVMTFTFTTLGYFNPSMQFGEWEAFGAAGAFALSGPMGLFLARNMATAVVTAFAAINRTLPALKAAFLLRAVEDGIDTVHSIIELGFAGALFPMFFFLIELFGLYTLFTFKEQ